MRQRGAFVATIAIAGAIVAGACGEVKQATSPPPATSGGGTTATTPAAPTDATFTYESLNTIVTSFDPATAYSNEVIALNNIYEQLTRYDSTTKTVKPLLATRWTPSADGKTWTFTLRPGATFHTGKPVDAASVKASLERTIKLGGGAAYEWGAVDTIDTPDPATVVFHLKYPAPLDLISSSAYAAYIYDTTAAGAGDLAKWFETAKDAGSGPYTVASWSKGQENELRLEAYPAYWGGWDGAHYKHVLFKYVQQPTTREQLLESGEATFADRLSPELFTQAKSSATLQSSERSSFQNLIAFLNTASGPLKDPNIRRAVALAIDYPGIIAALKGSAVPASGFIPDGLLGYADGLAYTQDVAQAKSLVAASAQKNITLTMTHANGDADQDLVSTIMKSDLAQIGITLNVKPLEWQTQWDQAKSTNPKKRQDIFVMYWYPDYADPFSWFTNLFHSASPPYFNMSYLNDKAVDTTIDALQSQTATDKAAAETSYAGLQKTLLDAAVAIPLYVQTYQRAFAKTVSGYVDNPAYSNVVFIHELTPTG